MKKLLILIILILAGYVGYMYFAKGVNVIDKNYKKLTGTKEAVKKPAIKAKSNLILSLELGKHTTIRSAKIPEGDIRLLGIDEAKQSCLISLYNSQGNVTKGMDLRKIINNKWTLEVKLISIKASNAIFSISSISDPEDALMIAGSKTGTSAAGASENKECIISIRAGGIVSLKCKTLSYGSIRLDHINYSKDECSITLYNVTGKLSKNVDFTRHIGTQTVLVRIVSLQRNGATLALSMPGDRFEAVK